MGMSNIYQKFKLNFTLRRLLSLPFMKIGNANYMCKLAQADREMIRPVSGTLPC